MRIMIKAQIANFLQLIGAVSISNFASSFTCLEKTMTLFSKFILTFHEQPVDKEQQQIEILLL